MTAKDLECLIQAIDPIIKEREKTLIAFYEKNGATDAFTKQNEFVLKVKNLIQASEECLKYASQMNVDVMSFMELAGDKEPSKDPLKTAFIRLKERSLQIKKDYFLK